MNDLLDIAARLDACWLDIVASDSETPTLSRCGNLMSEASRALRELAVPKPIGDAPEDDRWILGYDPASTVGPPWLLVTRCDDGWHDEAFYEANPTMWVPLPDPQPEPTGWRKAEGKIRIIKAWSKDIPWLTHLVEVIKPDGGCDEQREPDMATGIEEARRRAAKMAATLGLPVVEVDDKNVLPFLRKRPTQ